MDLKVLIVEDNFIIQMFLESGIESMGHKLVGAVDNGVDALHLIEAKKPNLILLDIGLAGKLSGIQVGKRIKEKYQIPFVYLTGNLDGPTLEKASHTRPIHIIKKPIDEEKLRSEISLIIKKLGSL